MTKKWRYPVGLLLIPFSLTFSACTQGRTDKKASQPIRVGEFASLSGKESSFGQSAHRGLELAFQEVNDHGGLLGRRVELISRDNLGRLDESRKVVEELIVNHEVVAVIGEVASDRTLEGAKVAQRLGVPLITPNSTNPMVTQMGSFVFRVCYTDPQQGLAMAIFAREKLKIKRISVLRDRTSQYSQSLTEAFALAFQRRGGQILSELSYDGADDDFTALLKTIRKDNPEAIFIPGYYNEVGRIFSKVAQMGLQTTLLGGDGWDSPRLQEAAGALLADAYFTNHFSPEQESSKVRDFVGRYQKHFGESPDGVAAQAYDSAQLLFQAIRSGRSTERGAIRNALAEIREFQGISGPIRISADRDATKPIVILKVTPKKFKFVAIIAPPEETEIYSSLEPKEKAP